MSGGLVEVVSCMFLDAALRGEVRASELHSSMTKRFRKGYPNSLHVQLSGLPSHIFLDCDGGEGSISTADLPTSLRGPLIRACSAPA
jgi:hypothetical protein